MIRCRALNSGGGRCGKIDPTGLCAWHDPERPNPSGEKRQPTLRPRVERETVERFRAMYEAGTLGGYCDAVLAASLDDLLAKIGYGEAAT